jgi:hypothetical protein
MILCYGQNIVSRILTPIHIWKCTGDSESAKAFVENYSTVPDLYLKIRKIINDTNIPRRLELYYNLEIDEEKNVTIKSYPETHEGIIYSFVDRYIIKFYNLDTILLVIKKFIHNGPNMTPTFLNKISHLFKKLLQ